MSVANSEKITLREVLSTLYRVILFDTSNVLEVGAIDAEAVGIANSTHPAKQSTRRLLLIYALLTIVLVNAYKGIVTTSLTPIPPYTQKYWSVNEAENFVFYTSNKFVSNFDQLGRARDKRRYGYQVESVVNPIGSFCHPEIPEHLHKSCAYLGHGLLPKVLYGGRGTPPMQYNQQCKEYNASRPSSSGSLLGEQYCAKRIALFDGAVQRFKTKGEQPNLTPPT